MRVLPERFCGYKVDTRKTRYPVSRAALQQIGLVFVQDDDEAILVWWDGYIPVDSFLSLLPTQRINKIPGMDIICYKCTTFQALNHMKFLYPQYYTFFPTTFQLPFQFGEFQKEHLRLTSKIGQPATWIVKPRSGCCGNGIRLIQNSFDVTDQSQPAIIQKYIEPYLIDGYKFDFRFYVLISNLDPLTVYIYDEGLARFCSSLYHPPNHSNLGDRFSHLTNTAVNVGNTSENSQHSILELASNILRQITRNNPNGKLLWNKIKQLATLSVIAIYQSSLSNAQSTLSRPPNPGTSSIPNVSRFFHLLGIDVLISRRLDPILLELNDRPSLCVTYDIEKTLKTKLIVDTLNLVTANGTVPGPKAILGGWQPLLPVNDASNFDVDTAAMVKKIHDSCIVQTFGQRRIRGFQNYLTRSPIIRKQETRLPPLQIHQ